MWQLDYHFQLLSGEKTAHRFHRRCVFRLLRTAQVLVLRLVVNLKNAIQTTRHSPNSLYDWISTALSIFLCVARAGGEHSADQWCDNRRCRNLHVSCPERGKGQRGQRYCGTGQCQCDCSRYCDWNQFPFQSVCASPFVELPRWQGCPCNKCVTDYFSSQYPRK